MQLLTYSYQLRASRTPSMQKNSVVRECCQGFKYHTQELLKQIELGKIFTSKLVLQSTIFKILPNMKVENIKQKKLKSWSSQRRVMRREDGTSSHTTICHFLVLTLGNQCWKKKFKPSQALTSPVNRWLQGNKIMNNQSSLFYRVINEKLQTSLKNVLKNSFLGFVKSKRLFIVTSSIFQ